MEASYENGKKVELTADQYTAVVSGTDSLRLTTYSPTVTIDVYVGDEKVGSFTVNMKPRTDSTITITTEGDLQFPATNITEVMTLTAQANASNGGKITANADLAIQYSDNGSSWTNYDAPEISAAVDENGVVTITIGAANYSGVTVGRQYKATITGVAEDGETAAATADVVWQIVSAS